VSTSAIEDFARGENRSRVIEGDDLHAKTFFVR
jgi:hypothetical protein